MTVFIHIGFSKTGTTSIQNAMFRNADRLRKDYSINYPGFAANHWFVALPFLQQQEYQPWENRVRRGYGTKQHFLSAAEKFLEEFESEAKRYRTHVLSAEQFHLLNRGTVGALRDFFVGLGLQTKIVVYVRHPAERISSLLSQKLRAGWQSLTTFPIEDVVTPTLRTYIEVFGRDNMIVRRFGDRYFVEGDLIQDFATVVHGAPIAGLKGARLNGSLSTAAVLLADQLFGIAPAPSGGRGNERYLNQIAGPKFLATRSMVEAAIEANRGCLDFLDREFGIRFDAVDLSAFPETISREFSAETIASIAAILNEQSLLIGRLTAEVERSRERGIKCRIKRFFRIAGRGELTGSR